uniref:Dynein heavy chain domain 1 n=1 Tax=Pelusios castaneus TaxID=367368 RepID=A0A8C8SJT4_9SAUR
GVFAKVLQRNSRSAWLHLLDVLQLLRPFREQLRCRKELLPYLESLCYQYRCSQALVSDLDVLGAMGQAFPKDHSELCCRDLALPAKLLPPDSVPAFARQPCPFVLGQEVEEPTAVSQPGPVSLEELQNCVGLVGVELAQDETQWKSSLGLMSLALGTNVPVKYSPAPQGTEGGGGLSWQSLTGIRAAEIFVRNRHLGKINFVYLNVAPNRHFRPYDLVVVPKWQANPQHYIFSPFGVLHVHPEEGAEALTLGEWHREAMLWQLLQCIPFFKHCLVRKAFACWWQNVKHLGLLRRQEALGSHLLLAMPHFGAALLHISRLLQELKSVHWLPQDDSKCYTFPELQRALAQENDRARGLLRRFLTFCSAILELVRDDTYKTVHGLQTQVQRYKLCITKESLYQQRVHYKSLERRLKEAEFWMQRLGSLAQLVNILTCQNLVSIVQEEITTFVRNVMKAVLRVHLVFDADNQLVPFPSNGWLRPHGLSVSFCAALTEADKGGAGTLGSQPPTELLPSLPAEVLCGQEPQLVHHLDLKVIGGLEVSGHRLRSQYPAPSREQLEQDLRSDSNIQEARASQRALLEVALNETQEICKQLAWVAEIHSFAHCWSPKNLEQMKGWPAKEYVQRVVQLRMWAERVKQVPSTVITCNQLLFVDCSIPLLDSMIKEILGLLLNETSQRSESLISELGGIVQLYRSVSTDVFTIAKCFQKVWLGQVLCSESMQSACVYLLSPLVGLYLCPQLLDTWEAFVYQQQEASDFIVSRRLSIIAELVDALEGARAELQELLTMATTGRFLDPSQSPCAMEQELRELYRRFQATASRVAELCRSQRILTGMRATGPLPASAGRQIPSTRYTSLLLRTISEQITEWKCLTFSKFNAPLAMEKMSEWEREASHMETSLPTNHPILQACAHMITSFQQFLPLLQKLWNAQQGNLLLSLVCVWGPQIWSSERGRCHSLDRLRWLQKAWAERQFRLVNFILNVPYQAPFPDHARRLPSRRYRPPKQEYISKDSGTFVLPLPLQRRKSTQGMVTLTPLSTGALLEVWVSFQQKWIFLNIVLYEMNISLPSSELDCLFQRLDSRFRGLMQVTCADPLVLSSVISVHTANRESRFMGVPLQAMLREGVGNLQLIIQALENVLEATRMGFPRLFFLSNAEVVAMVASSLEPMEVTSWARRCFPTVQQLVFSETSATRDPATCAALLPVAEATGLVGACGEVVLLCSSLPLNQKVTKWLCALEQHMKKALFHLLQSCMAQRLALRPQLDMAFEQRPGPTELPLHLLAEHWGQLATSFPAQCVLLAEEALWCTDVQEWLFSTKRQRGLKLKHRLKLEALAHYARNYRSSHAGQPGSAQLCTLLGALLTAIVNQRDVLGRLLERKIDSPAAFEWAQLLKYRLALPPERAKAVGAPIESWAASPPGCWVELLNGRLHYDYEYVGPCPPLVGSPQLDRSCLGFLLALQEFRCGAALGCQGVGKTATVQHLARALGRQLVSLHCSQQMGLGCLSRHLSGAVQAGAWLLLEAVNQLGPSILSGFSQLLADLQLHSLPEQGLAKTEPYQSRVLGNVLFGERLLCVRETYGCLATLQHLPELLHLALRPVALLPPDLHKVAEVTLLAAGFRETARLAKKLSNFFWLEGELAPGPAPSRVGLLKGIIETAINTVYPPVQRLVLGPGEQLPTQQSFEGLAEEPALIQALCLSPFLSTLEDPRLSRVWELLRGVFPASCSTLPEAHMPPRLLSAITAQLQEDKLHADPVLTSTIVQLCQALLGSPGVLLVGPSGSGKTTAWKTLAKVLSRLAAMAYQPISTVCLCPNSLSTTEFLGRMEGGIWREGIFSRTLQRMASSAPPIGLGVPAAQHWLVLDGSACSDWLDPISSLFSADPALSLPSGQQLQPPEGTKFLFELPDVSSISPSISTHCALVHCEGSCVWQAVLASFLATVCHTYCVPQESMAMLHGLTEDVFPPTLTFLQQHCSSVLQPHADLRSPLAWGIPETTAFTRLLTALLDQHLSQDKAKVQPQRRDDLAGEGKPSWSNDLVPLPIRSTVPAHHQLLVRSIFVCAYIWGFSGHLHPRHWVLFDSFARRVLYSSRYTIELPSADSVFDLYPQPEDGKLEVFDGKYLSSRVKVVPVTIMDFIPSTRTCYERVLYVLDLLLASKQPVLLAGEPGCGKSSFMELLIQPNHAYHRIAVSPALSTGHLRRLDKALLAGLPAARASAARAGKSCCLLLLDDLHAAELDPRRESHPMVETLRQALSYQELYGTESLELRHFSSAGLNCFGTVAAPVVGVHPLSPRFTRLFSILSLPTVSRESLLSIHSPGVLAWLEKFPLLARHHELASALVGATVDVYEAVKARFHPSPAHYPYHFSYHHIEKVLKGLFLLRPCPGIHLTSPWEDPSVSRATKRSQLGISFSLTLSTRVIVRLWLHESLRTFCDPLLSARERQESGQLLLGVAASTFCTKRSVLRVVSTSHRELQQREPASPGAPTEMGDEEDISAGSPEEPSSQSGSDVDFPDAFDPIEQAPVLALDQPEAAPVEGSALGALEPEEAGVTERKKRGKHRPSTRKESTKPLLPSHLLLLPGEEVHNILFSRELGPASSSQENPYQERSWDTLEQQLSTCLPRGFVLCREVTQHLVRLLRVLCCPRGHGALIALHLSTGRRSLVDLAAKISASQLFELAEEAEEWEVTELIKKASWQAGILGRRAVLLVHQGVQLASMQKVVNVMREGTYPGLYTTEDTAHIVKELLQENQAIKRTMRESLLGFYQFVKDKLHVLLLLDGRKGQAQGREPFGYPSAMAAALLSLTCSTDVYQPWSHTALLQVATQHLEDALSQQPLQSPASLQAPENSLATVATAMALIHRSARCYAMHLAPSIPLVTPKAFLDFLHIFLMLSAQLRGQMKLALTKMQAVSEKQREHSRDIRYLQEKLRKAKEVMARCQQRVEREELVQKQQEQGCQHHEARIDVLTQDAACLSLPQMNTDYRAALAGLQSQDIEELRSYRLPPAPIVRVTDTLCMMFSKEPGWASAKQLLGQEDFYQELLFYPKDELPNELFQALSQVVSDESFCAAALQSASKAAAALCQWICAIYWYHRALRIWQPTLVQLQHCKLQIRAEKGRLGDRRLQAEKLKELSTAWGLELLQATEHQKSVARELSYVLEEKEKADTLLEQKCSTAQGDALLCAAALSYLGAFPTPRRQELLEKWQDICAGHQSSLGPDDVRRLLEKELPCPGPAPRGPALLPVQHGFSLLALLSSKREQRAWDRDRKPQDWAGRQAALLLRTDTHACTRRWPLLLDPDQQALTWLLESLEKFASPPWCLLRAHVRTFSCLLPDMSLLFSDPATLPNAEEPGTNEESLEKNLQVLSAMDPSLEQNLLAAASAGKGASPPRRRHHMPQHAA